MAWARVDDGFHDHPKVEGLSLAAVGLWTLCLTSAHRHRKSSLVPGHIAEAKVKRLAGKDTDRLVAELVSAGLWEQETGIGGYVIHDFCDYLPRQRDPEERKEAGSRGGRSRAHQSKEPARKLPVEQKEVPKEVPTESQGTGVANPSSRASAPASPSRPVPSREDSAPTVPPLTAVEQPSSGRHAVADAVLASWWERHKHETTQSFITLRGIVRTAVNQVGASPVALAMEKLAADGVAVSGGSLQNALRVEQPRLPAHVSNGDRILRESYARAHQGEIA